MAKAIGGVGTQPLSDIGSVEKNNRDDGCFWKESLHILGLAEGCTQNQDEQESITNWARLAYSRLF